jgi:zinc transport system substrate-binding protein
MLWEAEPLEETARRLAELGVRSVVFAPCGNTPDDGDFLTVMNQNVTALAAAE